MQKYLQSNKILISTGVYTCTILTVIYDLHSLLYDQLTEPTMFGK